MVKEYEAVHKQWLVEKQPYDAAAALLAEKEQAYAQAAQNAEVAEQNLNYAREALNSYLGSLVQPEQTPAPAPQQKPQSSPIVQTGDTSTLAGLGGLLSLSGMAAFLANKKRKQK